MKIQNSSNINSPSFGVIRDVRYLGLYKKNKNLAKKVFQELNMNPKAMEFCQKYDVNITLNAQKTNNLYDEVESYFAISYDDPTRSLFGKFFDFLFGKQKAIKINSYGYDIYPDEALVDCTKNMINNIANKESPNYNKLSTGILDYHIDIAEEEIQAKLNKKTEKLNKKKSEIESKQNQKIEAEKNSSELQSTINELINSSK